METDGRRTLTPLAAALLLSSLGSGAATQAPPSSKCASAEHRRLEPLAPGPHTIVVHGINTVGADKTFTYHLNIE